MDKGLLYMMPSYTFTRKSLTTSPVYVFKKNVYIDICIVYTYRFLTNRTVTLHVCNRNSTHKRNMCNICCSKMNLKKSKGQRQKKTAYVFVKFSMIPATNIILILSLAGGNGSSKNGFSRRVHLVFRKVHLRQSLLQGGTSWL